MVVFLHGGTPRSPRPTHPWQLSVLSVSLLARSCLRGISEDTAVCVVRFGRRGWNDAVEPHPVLDLAELLAAPPGIWLGRPGGARPEVTLVGHSMGGRAALWVAARHRVDRLVLLAPWLESSDPIPGPDTRQVVIVHGTGDAVTSPQRSADLAARLATTREVGRFVPLAGATHWLVDAWGRWVDAITAALAD